MDENQEDVFQSSPTYENGNNLLAKSCMIIDKDDEDEGKKLLHNNIVSNKPTKKTFHQFYFVKFPSFKEEIQKADELNNKINEAKRTILDEINSIKAIHKINRKSREDVYYNTRYSSRRNIGYWSWQLSQLPEGSDSESDSEQADSKNVDKEIQKLSSQITHGSKTIADERKLFKEFKALQRKKEQPYDKVKTRNHKKTALQEGLNQLQGREQIERKLEQKWAETEMKEMMYLEEKLAKINQKKAKLNEYIYIAHNHLSGQIAQYDENMKLLMHAKELATKNDLVSLEDLSHKQVEDFLSLWNKDNTFRANYEQGLIEVQKLKVQNLAMEIETSKWTKKCSDVSQANSKARIVTR